MITSKDKLPVQQFERIGISSSRVAKFPKDEMTDLLSGKTSKMKFLVFKDNSGTEQKVNAKLSLYHLPDGSVGLKVHPYRSDIKNDLNLSKDALDKIKSGDTVSKVFNGHHYLVQLDKSINELRKIQTDKITVPDRMGQTQLSAEQKKELTEGKKIHIKDATGNRYEIKLDLLNPKGFTEKLVPGKKLDVTASSKESKSMSYQQKTAEQGYKIKR